MYAYIYIYAYMHMFLLYQFLNAATQELGTQMDLQLVLLPFADVAEAPARVLLNAAREGNAAEAGGTGGGG